MAKLKLKPDERVVTADNCLLHKGPVAFQGELTLTTLRLVWIPTRGLSRLAGARPLGIKLKFVEGVGLTSVNKMLTVTVSGKTHRFSGVGAHRMKERLDLHVAAEGGQALTEEDRAALEETVLFQEDVLIYLKGNLSTKGLAVLTDKRLRLETKKGLETALLGALDIDAELHQVETSRYNTLANKLEMVIDGKDVVLGGSNTSRLFLLLQSLSGHLEGTTVGFECEGRLYKGPLAIKGNLLANQDRVLFCPTSQLDSLVGAQTIDLDIPRILKVDIQGWPEQRLVITDIKDQDTVFMVTDPQQRLAQLRMLLMSARQEPLFVDERQSAVDDDKARAALRKAGLSSNSKHFYLIEWCLLHHGESAFSAGWLIVTTDTVLLLKPGKGTLWQQPLSGIKRIHDGKSEEGLRLAVGQNIHHLFPQGGREFINHFWYLVGQLRPETQLDYAQPEQPLQKILGRHATLSIKQDGFEILSTEKVSISHRSGKLTIRFAAPLETAPIDIGAPVHIELARHDARYIFHTVVLEEHCMGAAGGGPATMVVDEPDDVVAFSLRSKHRMQLHGNLTVWVFKLQEDFPMEGLRFGQEGALKVQDKNQRGPIIPDNLLPLDASALPEEARERVESIVGAGALDGLDFLGVGRGRLVNISGGGCGIRMKQQLATFKAPLHRLVLKTFLPYEGKLLKVQIRVSHEQAQAPRQKDWYYGVSFVGLHLSVVRAITTILGELERRELREKADQKLREMEAQEEESPATQNEGPKSEQ